MDALRLCRTGLGVALLALAAGIAPSARADALAAIGAAGYGWTGTFGLEAKEAIETGLGALRSSVTFPPEWDDAYLYARMLWPDAKVVRLGAFRIVTSDAFPAACRRVALL